jgi:hypothetical protein
LVKLRIAARVSSKTNVLDGIGAVRRMVLDHQGHRGLVLNPRCRNAIREFSHYHRKKLRNGEYDAEPATNVGRSNADDGPDCVRCFAAFNLEGRGGRIEAYRVGRGW